MILKKHDYYRIIFLTVCWLLVPVTATIAEGTDDPVKIAVLEFELNDLTLDPRTPEEVERTASIKPLLAQILAEKSGFQVIDIDTSAQNQANKGFGYLLQHTDAAADLGQSAGADWIVVGRVHKASFLFVYLMAQLIDNNDKRLIAELIVEVKGPQQRLTIRGVESLAEKIAKAIETRGQT